MEGPQALRNIKASVPPRLRVSSAPRNPPKPHSPLAGVRARTTAPMTGRVRRRSSPHSAQTDCQHCHRHACASNRGLPAQSQRVKKDKLFHSRPTYVECTYVGAVHISQSGHRQVPTVAKSCHAWGRTVLLARPARALERAGEGKRGASSPAVCVARPWLSSRPSGSEGVKAGHWAVPRWP